MFGNYAAQAGVIAGKNFASVNIEWNFNNVLVLGFDPFPSNINDRPRINTWRSDGENLNYISGGRYVFYPPFSPTGEIFEPWGDRNTGSQNINIPLIGDKYAGVDVFIPSDISVIFEPPIGPNSWQKVGAIPGEDKYQYLLKNGKNPTLKISLNDSSSTNFWNFTSDPYNKILNNFNISYAKTSNNEIVIANWNDCSLPTQISSGINYNHFFESCSGNNSNINSVSLYVNTCSNDILIPAYYRGNLRSIGTKVYATSSLNTPITNGDYAWLDRRLLPGPNGRYRWFEINNGEIVYTEIGCGRS